MNSPKNKYTKTSNTTPPQQTAETLRWATWCVCVCVCVQMGVGECVCVSLQDWKTVSSQGKIDTVSSHLLLKLF